MTIILILYRVCPVDSIILSSSNEYHQDCKFAISWVDQGFNQGLVAYKRQGSETVDRDYSCHSLSWLLLIPPQPVVVQCETTAHCFATAKLPIPLLNYQCHWHPAQSTVKQLNTLKPSWVQKQDLIISLVVFPPFANSWAWSWSTEGSIFLCKCRSDLHCQACQNSSLQWLYLLRSVMETYQMQGITKPTCLLFGFALSLHEQEMGYLLQWYR